MKIRPIFYYLIIPLALLAVAWAEGSNLVLRLFFLAVLVLTIGYIWTRLGRRGIAVQVRPLPDYCQVGEELVEEIIAINNSKLPKLWLKVTENSDLPGYANTAAFNLSPRGSYRWRSNVSCQRRGRYHLGAVTATVTDPFGLFTRQNNLGEGHQLLVYPTPLDLPFFRLSSAIDFDYGAGHRLIRQIGPEVASVREFANGDNLSRVHWPSTAHAGKLMVKVFEASQSHQGSKGVWVILDMYQPHHLGEDEESTEEYGITIATSLIKKYLDEAMSVGLVARADQPYRFLPQKGEQHFRRLLPALALMKARGQVSIDRVLAEEMEHFTGDAAIIIITPSATEEMVSAMRRLELRGNLVVAILLDAESFGGTVSPANAARHLAATGVKVYLVRQGDQLARVLDSRVSPLHTKYES